MSEEDIVKKILENTGNIDFIKESFVKLLHLTCDLSEQVKKNRMMSLFLMRAHQFTTKSIEIMLTQRAGEEISEEKKLLHFELGQSLIEEYEALIKYDEGMKNSESV